MNAALESEPGTGTSRSFNLTSLSGNDAAAIVGVVYGHGSDEWQAAFVDETYAGRTLMTAVTSLTESRCASV